jgi:signal transduction histidine kinase
VFLFLSIVALSLAFQVAAAILAIRLIRIIGLNWAWIMIATAILAMAIRPLAVFLSAWIDPNFVDPGEYWSETIGLLAALAMLAGIAAIAPLFRTIQRAKETTQRDRDELDKEVRQRTVELVRANEMLKKEFDERARVEEALREEHLHQRQLLELSEREQRLLAYEIHDGFVQPATAALMHLQASLSSYKDNPEGALGNVVRGLQLLQESITQVRWLIRGLRPVVLEDLGLVAAVENLVADTKNRTEVEIGWSHQVAFSRLPQPLEMAIFRIIQEALRNALRHSGTERVEIALNQVEGTVAAKIQDWGCGFDSAQSAPNHFGLEGMRERARMMGGTISVQSATGKGTLVTAEFKIP